MPQVLCSSDSHLLTDKWLFLESLRCDVILLCNFHYSFDVLALCSHFPKPSGILFSDFLPTRAMVQSVLLRAVFRVAASTLLFVRPPNILQSILRSHPPSTQLPHHICGARQSTLRWSTFSSLDWLQPNSFLQFFAHFSNKPSGLVPVATSAHPAGRPLP